MRKTEVLKLRFCKFKKFVTNQVSFWGAPTYVDIIEFHRYHCKNQRSGTKLCVAFLLFQFWKELWRFKVKEPMIFCWTKIWTLKTRLNRKWKISRTGLERLTLYFSSYKNRKLKVKLWWVGARERKKRAFFVRFILSKGIFF